MAKLIVRRFDTRKEAEAHYLSDVDKQAEACRAEYITPGFGQAVTYQAKLQEALTGIGPLIQAEAQALGVAPAVVVVSVLGANERWQQVNALIEANRVKAKAAIRQASTSAEMHRIVKELEQALAKIP